MNLIERFFKGFVTNSQNVAFSLNSEEYTYAQFLSLVNGSRMLLESQTEFSPQRPVGIFCNETAETYAAVFATWFAGGIFVPLNPAVPPSINNELIRKYNLQLVFSPGEVPAGLKMDGVKILRNAMITSAKKLPVFNWLPEQMVYILSTSGSTGIPKTVAINLKNLEAFLEGFLELYPELNESDNFLQTYELTADAAFTGYLIPFLLGATVFSVPAGGFKPFNVAKIISEKPVSWVQVTPSLLACLHPFFHSFHLENIKHFHFGGEALPAELVEEWRQYIPNAEISNVYGPTETTVTATIYKCAPGEILKSQNNIVSIGKPLKKVSVHIQENQSSDCGELFIAGEQVMEGYLYSTKQPFKELSSGKSIYYPTGDYVRKDENGFLYFCGRRDEQVKISGYRVDLTEIENQIRSLLPQAGNIAATAVETSSGLFRLVVFIENYCGNEKELTDKLGMVFPSYKIPEKIIGVEKFPFSSSGKADKKALVANYLKSQP